MRPAKGYGEKGRGLRFAAVLLVTALCISVLSFLAGLHAASGPGMPSSPPASSGGAVLTPTKMRGKTNKSLQPSSSSSHHTAAARVPLPIPNDGNSSGSHGTTPAGRHIMLDFYNIPGRRFSAVADTTSLHQQIAQLIHQSAMTLLGHSCHEFDGSQGITCVFLLSESHMSIHTWPEHGYAALDIFTCGRAAKPEVMEQGLAELLQPGLTNRQEQARGALDTAKLRPEQRQAKVLHTMLVNTDENEGMQQVLYQVPIIHTQKSLYQDIMVVEASGQMGRCLLLNNIIQFCAHDLDAYTDHMARHPLQMLQQLCGCGPASSQGAGSPALAASSSGVGLAVGAGSSGTTSAAGGEGERTALPPVVLPIAASDPIPLHVNCRAHLLLPPKGPAAAANGSSTIPLECGPQQHSKARVLMVGGGDGWIAKHLVECYGDWVSSVTAVEIDRAVPEVIKSFFSSSNSSVNPFNHPKIRWEYTDAYAWALKRVESCKASGPAEAVATQQTATAARRSRRSTLTSTTTTRNSPSEDTSNIGAGCAAFDVVIIDSTDFEEEVALQLHSTAFYKALYQLMSPRASLIQLLEIYMRQFEGPFATMEASLREAGWTGVGRSSVYTPSYGGEAVFLQGVKG